MNQNEKQLYDELRSTAEECDKLMNMIFERQSPSCELKNKYKTLKNNLFDVTFIYPFCA